MLLNPRVLIGLALVAALAFSHLFAYRKGASNVRMEWQASIAEANRDARKMEQLRQSRADEAQRLAVERGRALRADADRARRESDGLRDDLSAVRLHASKSLDAATKSVAALSDVFQQCVKEYSELAEIADRHASDSLTLQQSWPK